MTLSSLVGLTNINDKYMAQLVPALLIETAVAIIALFKGTDFFTEGRSTPHNKSEKIKIDESKMTLETINNIGKSNEKSVDEIVSESPTFQEYIENYNNLNDRFREQENYVKKIDGKKLRWQGKVNSVSSAEDNIMVILHEIGESLGDSFLAKFEKQFETDLFALRKGDIIEVIGIADMSLASIPIIECESFKIILP